MFLDRLLGPIYAQSASTSIYGRIELFSCATHPVLAVKPTVLFAQAILLPVVTSLRTPGFAYSAGFTNPTGLFLAEMRSSLIRLITEATSGAASKC